MIFVIELLNVERPPNQEGTPRFSAKALSHLNLIFSITCSAELNKVELKNEASSQQQAGEAKKAFLETYFLYAGRVTQLVGQFSVFSQLLYRSLHLCLFEVVCCFDYFNK